MGVCAFHFDTNTPPAFFALQTGCVLRGVPLHCMHLCVSVGGGAYRGRGTSIIYTHCRGQSCSGATDTSGLAI